MNNTEKLSANWENYYKNLTDSFLLPNEYVVRTFLGNYPQLNLDKNYDGLNVCDIGCGDGRNSVLLNKLGFNLYATEISDEICRLTKQKLALHPDKISIDIKKGFNWDLPFDDGIFDYVLTWNSCYYMKDKDSSFCDHLSELSRILKPDGHLVVSVPAPDCCTLIGAEDLDDGLVRIDTDTKYTYINGTVFRKFESWNDIEKTFGLFFKNYSKAELRDDCFGQALNYYVFVCQKK